MPNSVLRFMMISKNSNNMSNRIGGENESWTIYRCFALLSDSYSELEVNHLASGMDESRNPPIIESCHRRYMRVTRVVAESSARWKFHPAACDTKSFL
jgi:hypothetical protein